MFSAPFSPPEPAHSGWLCQQQIIYFNSSNFTCLLSKAMFAEPQAKQDYLNVWNTSICSMHLWHQSYGVSAPFAPLLVGTDREKQKVETAELDPKWSSLGIPSGLWHCLCSCCCHTRTVLEQSILSSLHLQASWPARQLFILCSLSLAKCNSQHRQIGYQNSSP